MELLSPFDLTALQWFFMAVCGMLIGMSKVGVPGVSLIVVPILAFIFGGKQSTGVLLPILMMADLFGVGYYRRHAEWKYLLKILPWAFVGVGIALWVGEVVNDEQFKDIIAIVVFICIGLMLWKDRTKNGSLFPDSWWFAALMGVLGGFATMIGNVAGPILPFIYWLCICPKTTLLVQKPGFF
nr:sulfite exporter TauE/SafE family protein [Sunxiuqinia indica]